MRGQLCAALAAALTIQYATAACAAPSVLTRPIARIEWRKDLQILSTAVKLFNDGSRARDAQLRMKALADADRYLAGFHLQVAVESDRVNVARTMVFQNLCKTRFNMTVLDKAARVAAAMQRNREAILRERLLTAYMHQLLPSPEDEKRAARDQENLSKVRAMSAALEDVEQLERSWANLLEEASSLGWPQFPFPLAR
jgi:hypothetical protein